MTYSYNKNKLRYSDYVSTFIIRQQTYVYVPSVERLISNLSINNLFLLNLEFNSIGPTYFEYSVQCNGQQAWIAIAAEDITVLDTITICSFLGVLLIRVFVLYVCFSTNIRCEMANITNSINFEYSIDIVTIVKGFFGYSDYPTFVVFQSRFVRVGY